MDLEKMRKLIIISLFADDYLYEKFVLKGGNALLVHNITQRGSMDIDVALRTDFSKEELDEIKDKLETSLNETFLRYDYGVIDVKLKNTPKTMSEDKKSFWGGYTLEFKIVNLEDKERERKGEINTNQLRQLSLIVDGISKKVFKIDISKYEFCDNKMETEIDGFPIYVYTPIMLVYEKLRALCQQEKEYKDIVNTNIKPRARDFYDIYSTLEVHGKISSIKEDIYLEDNLKDLVEIFSIKRVPLTFLENLSEYREFHRENFIAVENTVYDKESLESYDFYFNYTIKVCQNLIEKLSNLNMLDNEFATS